MAQDPDDVTRVLPGAGLDPSRTLVVGVPADSASANVTQMGVRVDCPVCRTSNSGIDTYCAECGFLLASAPGAEVAQTEGADTAPLELIEEPGGRRFRLRPGVNTVGRENCDVLLMNGTVSRKHAEVHVEGSSVRVTDLGSTNGSQVDGAPAPPNQPIAAAVGAVLRFGSTSLRLVGEAAEQPAAAVSATEAAPLPDANVAEDEPSGTEPGGPAPLIAILRSSSQDRADIELRLGATTVGRKVDNTVVLSNDPYVSGRHAEIVCTTDSCGITDLGSTNGTVVNGRNLTAGTPQPLIAQDEVTIGQGHYVFELAPAAGDGPAAGEPAPDDLEWEDTAE